MKLVLPAGAFLVALVAAQEASGPQQKVGSVGSAPKKSTPSKATPRPSPAIGNDIVRVIDSLVAAGAAKGKGEYETTEEYESRGRAVCARYGQLAFLLPDASFEYDADTGKMSAKVGTWLRLLDDAPESYGPPEAFVLKSERVRIGSYVGTNAFGAKTVIQSRTEFERGIIIHPSSNIVKTLEKGDYGLVVMYGSTFSLDIARARAIKPFLRALVVGKLAEARVYKGHYQTEATFDSPVEVKRDGVFLPILIDEIRILDIRSGKTIETLSSKNDTIDSHLDSEPHPDVKPSSVQGSAGGMEYDKGGSLHTGDEGVSSRAPVEGDSVPVLLSKIEAIYPPLAKQSRIQGVVKLNVVIGKNGSIQDLKAVSGHPLLVPAALEAVRQWLYKPAYKSGKPVATETTLEVSFSLP
jgi:TonB family protein